MGVTDILASTIKVIRPLQRIDSREVEKLSTFKIPSSYLTAFLLFHSILQMNSPSQINTEHKAKTELACPQFKKKTYKHCRTILECGRGSIKEFKILCLGFVAYSLKYYTSLP